MPDYLTPKQAAEALGVSVATISRCVKRGAPVHRWGATGSRYRICLKEFVAWMEAQGAGSGEQPQKSAAQSYDAEEMAKKRRAMMRAL